MRVFVYSEWAAPLIVRKFTEPYLWIQIKTMEGDGFLEPNSLCKAKLDLYFYDTSDSSNHFAFNEDLANKVWSWLDLHYSGDEYIFINCEAGLSRSAGMGIAIDECLLGNKPSGLRKQKPLANNLVERIMRGTYEEHFAQQV